MRYNKVNLQCKERNAVPYNSVFTTDSTRLAGPVSTQMEIRIHTSRPSFTSRVSYEYCHVKIPPTNMEIIIVSQCG